MGDLSTVHEVIRLTGAFLGGMVSGMVLVLCVVFDGVSIQVGKKGKQTLNLSIGEEENGG